MTLLVTVFAAAICTAVWYRKAPEGRMFVSVLCWIYWGASIMWLVDAIFEFAEEGSSYFTPEPYEMLNDLFLGLSVIALGLVVWVIVLLVKDPRGVFHKRPDKGADKGADRVPDKAADGSAAKDTSAKDSLSRDTAAPAGPAGPADHEGSASEPDRDVRK